MSVDLTDVANELLTELQTNLETAFASNGLSGLTITSWGVGLYVGSHADMPAVRVNVQASPGRIGIGRVVDWRYTAQVSVAFAWRGTEQAAGDLLKVGTSVIDVLKNKVESAWWQDADIRGEPRITGREGLYHAVNVVWVGRRVTSF